MKILSVFGTRPEAIKMAPVVKALEAEAGVDSVVCVTGQHREMLDQVLDLFGVRPDLDLNLMRANQSLNGLVSSAMGTIDEALERVRPDRVLVHGDTSTALAAALAAFHRKIPVGHVEAGLRTYDLDRPWPEEMNRQVVDRVSDLLFAPTASAAAHLGQERVQGRILVTGNTVIDALKSTAERLRRDAAFAAAADARLPALREGSRLVLVTGHRRENFGEGMRKICQALLELSKLPDVEVVYPVHLNPNVSGPVTEALEGRGNIHLTAPLDYVPFIRLMSRADLVLTDSGGVQEEAPALGKRVLVMRDTTERPEALVTGAVRLVGVEPTAILEAAAPLLRGRRRTLAAASPYGDGAAAERIVDAILGRDVRAFGAAEALQAA